jgi:hypothetical protein
LVLFELIEFRPRPFSERRQNEAARRLSEHDRAFRAAIGVKTSRETILYSRNHKNFNKRFPQIAEALGDLPADTVIDGEVVAWTNLDDWIFTVSSTSRPKLREFTTLKLI